MDDSGLIPGEGTFPTSYLFTVVKFYCVISIATKFYRISPITVAGVAGGITLFRTMLCFRSFVIKRFISALLFMYVICCAIYNAYVYV